MAALSRTYNAHFVYDCHENYELEALARSYRVPEIAKRAFARSIHITESKLAQIVHNVVIVAESQVKTFSHPNIRCLRIPNAASIEMGARRSNDYCSRGRYCITTASQYEDNGAIFILDIIDRLAHHHADARILVADRYKQRHRLRSMVLRTLESRDQSTYLQLLPNIPSPDIITHLNRARIGLLLDLDVPRRRAAMPIKLFEYMAAGLPVIATRVGQAADLIEELDCGIVVEAGDSDAYASAIQRLLDDVAGADAMGTRGRIAFENKYNFEQRAEVLRLVYEGRETKVRSIKAGAK